MTATEPQQAHSTLRQVWRGVFVLRPAPWRWRMGITAGLGVGLPLAAFTLAGYQRLGLIASMGCFTALYGDRLRLGERMKMLPLVGLGLVLASLLGVACSANDWLLAGCLVLVAGLSCAINFGLRVGPPGPMLFVLVAGISGYLAGLATGAAERLLIPAVIAVGALAAWVVVIAPLALSCVRRADGPATSLRSLFPWVPFDRDTATIMIRVLAAVAVAAVTSLPLGMRRAYWVVLVAGVILQASHVMRVTVTRSIQRIVGALLGLAIFWLIVLMQPSGLWLALAVALLQFATEVVIARNYTFGLLFITPLGLTIAAVGRQSAPFDVARDRTFDTLLGVAIAVAVLLIDGWLRGRWNRDS